MTFPDAPNTRPPEPSSYGDAMADVYDEWYPDVTDTHACARRLAALATDNLDPATVTTDNLDPATPPLRNLPVNRSTLDAQSGRFREESRGGSSESQEEAGGASRGGGGVVVELGVGTGRIALALAELGVDVRGIDASAAMLGVLRSKPGHELVAVELGDMADVVVPLREGETVPPPVDVVVATYNTLFNLPDAATQQRCLVNAAKVLVPGGRMVVEVFVPGDELMSTNGSDVRVRHVDGERVVLVAEAHEHTTQTITGQFIDLGPSGVHLRPFTICWQTPAQLDAMAAAAGLDLEYRWSNWDEPIGPAPDDGPATSEGIDHLDDAPTHIVVYRRR